MLESALCLSSKFTGTPLKYLETNYSNATWYEATSWLFTSEAEDLNSERPRTNPVNSQSGT